MRQAEHCQELMKRADAQERFEHVSRHLGRVCQRPAVEGGLHDPLTRAEAIVGTTTWEPLHGQGVVNAAAIVGL